MVDVGNLDLMFDFFDPFSWDKAAYRFNRDEKDMHPYSIINEKDRTIIVHNILGIDKKDLNLTISKEENNTYINIEGKTRDNKTKKDYSISSHFLVDEKQVDLNKITSTTKNGLLYITIPFKKAQEEKDTTIKINID